MTKVDGSTDWSLTVWTTSIMALAEFSNAVKRASVGCVPPNRDTIDIKLDNWSEDPHELPEHSVSRSLKYGHVNQYKAHYFMFLSEVPVFL